MKESYARALSSAVALLSALFIVDLSLDWRRVEVGVGSLVKVDVGSASGWQGWGWVAGIAAVTLLFYSLLEVAGYIEAEPGTEIPPAALAVILCLGAVIQYHNSVSVMVLGAAVVTHGWAATAGLVLAGALTVLTVARLLAEGPAFSGRSHPAH